MKSTRKSGIDQSCVLVYALLGLTAGCYHGEECATTPASVDYQGEDSGGNYIECDCGPTDTGVAGVGEARCLGGMTPRPGCGAYDFGVVDLESDAVVLTYDLDGYTYELTAAQRTDLRKACGLE